ncbi:hypothetical protein DM02DRAFT_129628 [Periconia macrospinosa]|uniref:Uncharacterized protein n=1 Tax=Periconia macrospinosa TaxID=97972 RepID=A0A2V1DDM0_9PLEO|nr:hypothetical protein DM02DRAFT_129628 [Periconia macrospinosa]
MHALRKAISMTMRSTYTTEPMNGTPQGTKKKQIAIDHNLGNRFFLFFFFSFFLSQSPFRALSPANSVATGRQTVFQRLSFLLDGYLSSLPSSDEGWRCGEVLTVDGSDRASIEKRKRKGKQKGKSYTAQCCPSKKSWEWTAAFSAHYMDAVECTEPDNTVPKKNNCRTRLDKPTYIEKKEQLPKVTVHFFCLRRWQKNPKTQPEFLNPTQKLTFPPYLLFPPPPPSALLLALRS